MDFERAFVAAGGLLMPVSILQAMVGRRRLWRSGAKSNSSSEAGFTPPKQSNRDPHGAKFLGEDSRIGQSRSANKPTHDRERQSRYKISDIEKRRDRFQDGVGYDSEKCFSQCMGWLGLVRSTT